MTVARDAEVRAYRPGDEHEIQRAFVEVFGVARPLNEWRWKFEQPPRGSRIVLAFDREARLACQYAAIVLDVAWFGETIDAGQIVDVLSRARGGLGRRGGPFLRTVESFLDRERRSGGLSFIFGFPGERHQRLGELGGLYNRTAPVARFVCELGRRGGTPGAGGRRISEGYDATALDVLWRVSAERYTAAVVRDARWFAWRYAARPGVDYLQIGVHRRGRPRAWGVVSVAGECARWVDLVWDGAEAGDLAALAAEVETRSRELGASRVELWLQNDAAAAAILRGRGYTMAPDPERRLSVIVLDPRLDLERVVSNLYLTLGDSDHV